MNEQLRDLIRKSNKSMAEIARETGVKYATLQGFLAGMNDATLSTASKLAPAVGHELKFVKKSK